MTINSEKERMLEEKEAFIETYAKIFKVCLFKSINKQYDERVEDICHGLAEKYREELYKQDSEWPEGTENRDKCLVSMFESFVK